MRSFVYNFGSRGEGGPFSGAFSFEPESIYDKKSGNLYMVGFLANALPQDELFLSELAQVIKNAHYNSSHKTIERALNDSLQDANSYLEKLIKTDRVGWMGNLSFAVFALRNRDFFFAKTGQIEILLLRAGGVIDLAQDLKLSPESDPAKVFGNLVSGKLQETDAILAATADIGGFIKKSKIDKEVANAISPVDNREFETRLLDQIFESKRAKIMGLNGSCVIISLRPDILEGTVRDFKQAESIQKVSLRGMFSPISAKNKTRVPKIAFSKNRGLPVKKFVVSITVLAVLVAGGFFAKSVLATRKVSALRDRIQAAAGNITEANNLEAAGNKPQAQALLDKTASDLDNIEFGAGNLLPKIQSQIDVLQASIDSASMSLNGSQIVTPAVEYEFAGFLPKRIVNAGGEILAFIPGQKGIYSVNGGSGKLIDTGVGFDLAASNQNSVIFFSKPDSVMEYKNGNFGQTAKLGLPSASTDFGDFGVYSENLYFIDSKNGLIIKYLRTGKSYSLPQLWLDNSSNPGKLMAEKSLTFDRNAWLLNSNGTIDKFFAGKLEQNLKPVISPAPEGVTKIITSTDLPNLYVLDPNVGRIIILTKDGQLIKQLVSEQFKGASDFIVQSPSNEIVVLSGNQLLKVIQ